MTNIPRRLVLKDNHPTMVKLHKLIDLADELGLTFHFNYGNIVLEDNDRDPQLPPLFIEDIEPDHSFHEFPFATEFKVIYKNPAYLEQQTKLYEEDAKRRKEAAEAAARAHEEERLAREERKRQEQEAAERMELVRLKTKYEAQQ